MDTITLEQSIAAVATQRINLPAPKPMQPPCPEHEITRLRAEAKEKLGVEPPERYLDLLRITNGISENGLMVYASRHLRNIVSDMLGRDYFIDGFVEANQTLRLDREGYDQLLVFAFSGMYVHVQDLESGKYGLLAHDDDLRPTSVFDTFDELMADAVRRITHAF